MTRQPLAQAEIARRRTEIHQAARAVIAAEPYSATLVNQLSATTGYDRRMIFRCYRNKEEIFGDVLREEYARWCTMSLKALLPFNEEKIRQHLIRYATNEPRLAHLIAGLPAILAGLVSGRQAQLLDQLDALAAPAGSELDARLPFFMPGYGAAWLTVTPQVLALATVRAVPNRARPAGALQQMAAPHPEWVVRTVMAQLAGWQAQAELNSAALASGHLNKWGSTTWGQATN